MPDRDDPGGRVHWMTGSFIAAVGLMAVSILFVRPAIAWLASQYTKQPAVIRRPLRQFDCSAMPSLQQGWDVSIGQPDTEDIGTGEALLLEMVRNDGGWPRRSSLFVTYYNDPKDTVPHTPDVCWRQGGYVVHRMETIAVATPRLASRQPQVEAVLIVMGNEQHDVVNLHLFMAEGRFLTSRNRVRLQIARPGHRQTYFCKIEIAVQIHRGEDPSAAIELGKRLVSETLPVLLADHFPTDEQLQQRP